MCGADAQGAGILLAGASAETLQAASLAIKQALPPICSGCLLVLQARHPACFRVREHVGLAIKEALPPFCSGCLLVLQACDPPTGLPRPLFVQPPGHLPCCHWVVVSSHPVLLSW